VGQPIPEVDYRSEENAVWATVSSTLAERHRRYACAAFMEGGRRLDLPRDEVPQLREVDRRLAELTGFHLRPVGGLVAPRDFYGALAERTFCSTQYVRHHSAPYYTPEPDIVHELIGHATMLYEAAGRASLRAHSDEALDFFSRVFWFTLEFGVVEEEGSVKAYGAGLLSSCGEIEAFHRARLVPFDLPAMGVTDYDITHYQPLLHLAPSFIEMVERLTAFFDSYDEQRFRELVAARR
jgi:phenylalanine-4-hydroxylase